MNRCFYFIALSAVLRVYWFYFNDHRAEDTLQDPHSSPDGGWSLLIFLFRVAMFFDPQVFSSVASGASTSSQRSWDLYGSYAAVKPVERGSHLWLKHRSPSGQSPHKVLRSPLNKYLSMTLPLCATSRLHCCRSLSYLLHTLSIVHRADLRHIPGIKHMHWHTVFPSLIYYRVQLIHMY